MKDQKYSIKVGTIYPCAPSYICECETNSIKPSLLKTEVIVTSEAGRGDHTNLGKIVDQLAAASIEEHPGLGMIPGYSEYEIRIKVKRTDK